MRITAISRSELDLAGLQRQLQSVGPPPPDVNTRRGGLEQLSPAADQDQPDILLVDRLCSSVTDLDALKSVAERNPQLNFILICEQAPPDFLLAAMQLGVRDVIPAPASAEALAAAVARIAQRLHAASAPRHRSTIAAFIGCKGGAGATFLAANLAYVLASEYEQRVALLDLDLNVGDAALFLSDRTPATTLADVALHISRLDASFLAGSMQHVLPNLGVLAAPETLEQAIEIKPEQTDTIIKLAAAEHDCVIMDLGRNFDRVVVKALDLADLVFPVLQLSLPFIRDAKRVLNTLHALGVPDSRVQLIVNRLERGSNLQVSDAEQALGRKIALTIPNSYRAVSASVDQGTPISKIDTRNPVTLRLRTLAVDKFGVTGAASRGWFGQLFGAA